MKFLINIELSSQFQNVSVCSRSRKTKILTTGIHVVFRGLKFEPDAEIGQISADFEMGRFEIGSISFLFCILYMPVPLQRE